MIFIFYILSVKYINSIHVACSTWNVQLHRRQKFALVRNNFIVKKKNRIKYRVYIQIVQSIVLASVQLFFQT